MSLHRTLCRNRDSTSAFSLAWALVRHKVAGCDILRLVFLNFCRDRQNYVATETAAISTFLLLLCWNYLIFQLTLAKHKVGEYSIIWHKNRSETVKNMQEKWIKNR